MGFEKILYVDRGVGITTPDGDIKLFLREVTETNPLKAEVVVFGSRLLPSRSIVELAMGETINLRGDITVKLSDKQHHQLSREKVKFYFDKPSAYRTYHIITSEEYLRYLSSLPTPPR